jgi:subtilase family serine protease
VHSAGITGAGETIAIAARGSVSSDDVAAFRTLFGLPESAIRILPNGAGTDKAP